MKQVNTFEPVDTVEKTVIWMTECTLATVESLRMRKTPPKSELLRQIDIAQVGINQIEKFASDNLHHRVQIVVRNFGGDVSAWAATIQY